MENRRVIKSYVWHGEECFFVSTIERDSSAMEGPRRYNETMVWKYDWDKSERMELVCEDGDSTGSIHTHQKVCKRIYDEGRYWDKEEGE